jgi:hypothetical protein
MPRKPKSSFDFVENPEKPLAASTLTSYKRYLNKLGEAGFKNKEALLTNAPEVVKTIEELATTKIQKNYFFAAIFYATGRQDYEKDPRGLPIFKAFQDNYKKS